MKEIRENFLDHYTDFGVSKSGGQDCEIFIRDRTSFSKHHSHTLVPYH